MSEISNGERIFWFSVRRVVDLAAMFGILCLLHEIGVMPLSPFSMPVAAGVVIVWLFGIVASLLIAIWVVLK